VIHRLALAFVASALVLAGLISAADPPAGSAGDDPPIRLKKKNRAPLPVPGKDDLDRKPIPEDQPPIDEQRKDEKLRRGDGDADKPEASEEDAKAVLERIGKNMRLSEDRLDRKELGDGLKAVQGDILKDIDALLRQQQQQSGGGGGGGGAGSGNPSGGQQASSSQGSGSGRGQRQQVARGMRNQPQQQQPGSKGSGSQLTKNDTPAGGSGQPGDKPRPPDREGNKGGDPNTLADVFKDDGFVELPKTARAEMDAYAREKFMSKYESLIREYYSTLSRKSRGKSPEEK
jgi:hypothetical protein